MSLLPMATEAASQKFQVHSIGTTEGLTCFDRHEWRVDTGHASENPFDPAAVRVDATFTGPGGDTLKLPAFWDVRPDAQTGAFFVRFAAPRAGQWSMIVTVAEAGGTRSSASSAFGVRSGGDPGFVRVADNKRYLRFDSAATYFPIGLNLCWPEGMPRSSWYETHFHTLADQGVNFARVWMCDPGLMLETSATGLGRYDLDHAAYFDRVLDAADVHGIRLMLCFLNHRELLTSDRWGKGGWDTNPYNAARGGPATQPTDFFTSPAAMTFLQNRLRYIVARYAAYTSVGFWEVFNEQENDRIPVTVSWNETVANYVASIDPYHHLLTTSAAVPEGVWRLPAMAITQTHIYGDGTLVDLVTPLKTAVETHTEFYKPHLVGEIGWSYKGPDGPSDPHKLGTTLHNAVWAGLASGNLGTGMYWWWDNYVFPAGL